MLRKWYLLQPDGAADEPQDRLGGKTPLEYARMEALGEMVRLGRLYRLETIPPEFPPGSEIGNLVLMGYDPALYYRGRAVLEAAGQGISLKKGEVVFRMNLVTLSENSPRILVDYSAGHISTDLARRFVEEVSRILPPKIRLYPGVSYRHLFVVEGEYPVTTVPPHDIQGKPIAEYLPRGPGAEELIGMMEQVHEYLQDHPLNRERIERGEPPANGIWLWGRGEAMELPPFHTLYPPRRGAVITAVDLVRGIGRLAGMEIIEVEGATGFIDTNFEGKARSAIESTCDFVFLHLEAPDECSHLGDLEKKLYALEQFDRRIVKPIWEEALRRGCGIIVTPDHPTYLRTRTHARGEVPCLIVLGDRDISRAKGPSRYCERAMEGCPPLRGLDLLRLAFQEEFPDGNP